jgi:hypothetical protein
MTHRDQKNWLTNPSLATSREAHNEKKKEEEVEENNQSAIQALGRWFQARKKGKKSDGSIRTCKINEDIK